jgi:hypothetical protein
MIIRNLETIMGSIKPPIISSDHRGSLQFLNLADMCHYLLKGMLTVLASEGSHLHTTGTGEMFNLAMMVQNDPHVATVFQDLIGPRFPRIKAQKKHDDRNT